jgi:hypothetical protein
MGKYYRNWFNVGGIRYLVGENGKYDQWVEDTYPLAWEDTELNVRVFENPTSWPRAFLTSRVLVEPDLDRQVIRLGEPGAVPPQTAIVQSSEGIDVTPGAKGNAIITSYRPSEVTIDCESDGKTLLVLSDRISSGWTATLDGVPVPIIRVNYMFRGVSIPAGSHVVNFRFQPPGFIAGRGLSAATALLLLACLAYEALRNRKPHSA